MLISLADIKIGQRHRQDMGDIDALAANIAEVGLLHPVVVTPANELIAGARRIAAFQQLGRSDIPATVVDLDRVVRGEFAENEFRKAFTPSEAVAIAAAIEPAEREKAKERQAAAGPSEGKGKKGTVPGIFPEPLKGRALDHVAAMVGKDRRTLAKASEVVQAAEKDPARFEPVKAEMDRTGNVDRAHKKVVAEKKRDQFNAELAAMPVPKLSDLVVVHADCLAHLRSMEAASVDVVCTSPPYNIGLDYHSYRDNRPLSEYLAWLGEVATEIRRVLRPSGSFFLNIGSTSTDPWTEDRVASTMGRLFRLQNRIVWVKAIAIGTQMMGHFKPVNSNRFLNQSYESIFHFTLSGDVTIDRLAIGVPYSDKSNIARIGHAEDRHCAGNVWFIPYDTVQSAQDKWQHPAGFPVELAERCIKLHGVRPGLTVLDPFLGSGTTLVAAQRLKCRGIGIEADDYYARIATARLGSVANAA